MSNIQAAVAYAQYENLNNTIKKKKELGKIYKNLLKDLPIKLAPDKTEYAENHYWIFGIVIDKKIDLTSKEVICKLREKGIETRPFFFPMHKQPILKKLNITDTIKRPISEYLYEKGFYIPMGLKLTEEEQIHISNEIKKIITKN